MRILFVNNDGGGFADYVEFAEGTTVVELFEQHMKPDRPEDYLIRVNRMPVSSGSVPPPNPATASIDIDTDTPMMKSPIGTLDRRSSNASQRPATAIIVPTTIPRSGRFTARSGRPSEPIPTVR